MDNYYTSEQKKFLTEKFQQGERSGRKSDPASVARSMMSAVDSQEKRMFSGEEFLTASQVAEFFPRLAAYKQCQGVTLNYNYKARQQESNGKINWEGQNYFSSNTNWKASCRRSTIWDLLRSFNAK